MSEYSELGKKVVAALNERGFESFYFDDLDSALKKILSFIPKGSSVGWGGSVSCIDSKLLDKIRSGDYIAIDRDTAKDSLERTELMRKCFTADYFLTSFNAVSSDGIVINIDGNGNRVAAISFGPKNVIALVGINKITESEQKALERAEKVAAAKNAVRFGKSMDEAPSLCNIYQKLTHGGKGRIKVILVGVELGY